MRTRELPQKMILAFLAFVIFSCGPAVRDKKVYEAEIEFIEAASAEQIERGEDMIIKYCTCEEVAGVKGFVSEQCQNIAETILVVKTRLEYHTAFMRFLGGLSEERPPKDPPEVPDTNTLCPGKLPDVPLKPEKIEDLPEGDAGTD